jgi:hypothetical protein
VVDRLVAGIGFIELRGPGFIRSRSHRGIRRAVSACRGPGLPGWRVSYAHGTDRIGGGSLQGQCSFVIANLRGPVDSMFLLGR